MSQTSSLPEVTSPDNAQSLGTYAPVMEIEDSHFQLPIRRHPRILSSIDEDSPTHTNGAPAGMESETIDGSDSESSQVILTPEAGLSEEEEMELHGSKEAVLDNSRVMNSEDVKDFYGAVGRGDLKRVKYHIDQGISVNSKTMNGYTPLVIAILEAQLEMTRLLLDHGASVHQRVNKTPPIVYAAMTAAPAPQFLKLLLEYGASPSTVHGSYYYNVLHWAAFIGNVDAVDFLISVGTDMEQTCSQGRTSLLIASTNGNTCVVKVLLAKGADINHRSHNGATALGWAACHDHVDTVRSLLEEGLDINGYDNRGISKCQTCCQSFIHQQMIVLRLKGSISCTPETKSKLPRPWLTMYHRPIMGSKQSGLHRSC
jgi:ankyrin repeat protein